MGNNRNDAGAKNFIEIIYYLSAIFSSSIITAIGAISAYLGGIWVFFLFLFIVIQILHSLVIPIHKNKFKGLSWDIAKPNIPLTIIYWVVIIALLIVIFVIPKSVEATDKTEDNEKTINIEVGVEDGKTEVKVTIDGPNDSIDNLETLTQTKDEIIESYIIRCKQEDVSIDELSQLSDEMLYYIRNGIFAYCGLYFSSGYYEQFVWYNAEIMSEEQFDWNLFNPYQVNNINNIRQIENERDTKEQIGK